MRGQRIRSCDENVQNYLNSNIPGSSGMGGFGRGRSSSNCQQFSSKPESQGYARRQQFDHNRPGHNGQQNYFVGGRGAGLNRDFERTTTTTTTSQHRKDYVDDGWTNRQPPDRGNKIVDHWNALDDADHNFEPAGRTQIEVEVCRGDSPSNAENSVNDSGFSSSFGGGFGSGFPQPAAHVPRPRKSSPKSEGQMGGGFMSFTEVQEEAKRIEAEKWADLPKLLKNFYVEDPSVTALTADEVDQFRLSKNKIKIQDLKLNRTAPKPVETFEQAFKHQPEILDLIRAQCFVEPSPIQCQMWPAALSGYDVIGIAQTGTGKTLAFLLPIFIHLDSQPISRKERKGPGCLILSPTRELAMQIRSEVKKYRYRNMKSVCLYGGGDRGRQVELCLEGVDIVIATPGRLNDLVDEGIINLRSITFVVLDEADRMLDMGFEPQIQFVLASIRPDRQTIMTSATWPKEVRRLAENYTKDPFLIVIGSLDLSACHNVTQVIEIIREEDKRNRLIDFLLNLKPDDKIIVFIGRKSLVDDLANDLPQMGIACQSMHGDRLQCERERALSDIRDGKANVLLATDVASRGLDIVDVTHVFNYDFPRNTEEYVHRIGRTGRAGRSGVSITFVTRYDWRNAAELIAVLEDAKQDVPQELRDMADRFEQKVKENPELLRNFRGGGTRKEKKPYCMGDYM